MKPQVIKVGSFSEDSNGHKSINGWQIDGTAAGTTPFTFEELKATAIQNGSYSIVDSIEVEPLEKFGIVERNENGDVIGFTGFNTL